MQPLSWVEISRSALRSNIRELKKAVGDAALVLVVKSNAYGHGLHEVVSIADRVLGVEGFATANLSEALAIAKNTRKPISVLSFLDDLHQIKQGVQRGIVFPVYDLTSAQNLNRVGRQLGRRIKAQVKIDVGTLRLGFRFDELAGIGTKLRRLSHLRIVAVFSHLADSENSDASFTKVQLKRFFDALAVLAKEGLRLRTHHIACSAAAIRNKAYRLSAVRVGIALYGLWPSEALFDLFGKKLTLKPVLSWHTRVLQVKNLKQGETVGYGLSYRAPQNTRIAVLPVGYWDGYSRSLSNRASVLIDGKRCRVRGRICMNMTMVELPSSVSARGGQEVMLLGSQGKERISADELAALGDTINYEVVTRIHPLLPRLITT